MRVVYCNPDLGSRGGKVLPWISTGSSIGIISNFGSFPNRDDLESPPPRLRTTASTPSRPPRPSTAAVLPAPTTTPRFLPPRQQPPFMVLIAAEAAAVARANMVAAAPADPQLAPLLPRETNNTISSSISITGRHIMKTQAINCTQL